MERCESTNCRNAAVSAEVLLVRIRIIVQPFQVALHYDIITVITLLVPPGRPRSRIASPASVPGKLADSRIDKMAASKAT